MNTQAIALAQKIQYSFEKYRQQEQFSYIAKLITYAFSVVPKNYNRQIFGYIPNIFREVELIPTGDQIQPQLFVGEPVVYKIYYPNQNLYGIPYFYIFCYLKQNSSQLNVYFQSANPKYKDLSPKQYHLDQEKISFEGCVSAFNSDNISVISVSDPGHFVPDFTSSYYVGSSELNFTKLIAECLENICRLSQISPHNTLLFGSSAGTFGALLSSTYFQQKTNVLAVNSQISLQYRKDLMQFFGINQPQELLDRFGGQISCIHRFQQKINSVPNIYVLANINDNLYQRNLNFYQQYITKHTKKGLDNQSVFDSYYGVEGHGRPEPSSLIAKIRIAREVLTMKSTID